MGWFLDGRKVIPSATGLGHPSWETASSSSSPSLSLSPVLCRLAMSFTLAMSSSDTPRGSQSSWAPEKSAVLHYRIKNHPMPQQSVEFVNVYFCVDIGWWNCSSPKSPSVSRRSRARSFLSRESRAKLLPAIAHLSAKKSKGANFVRRVLEKEGSGPHIDRRSKY